MDGEQLRDVTVLDIVVYVQSLYDREGLTI